MSHRLAAFAVAVSLASAAAPTPLAAQTGSVRLESEPGTSVHWEGVDLGKTDDRGIMRIQGIPLGRFEVELTKDGFEPTSALLHVGEGENVMPIALRAIDPAPVDVPEPTAEPPAPLEASTETRADIRAAPEPEPRQGQDAEAGGTSPEPTPPFVWAAVALAAVVSTLLLRRRYSGASEVAPGGPAVDAPVETTLEPAYERSARHHAPSSPPPGRAPGFLEDLKQRERDLEGAQGIRDAHDDAAPPVEMDVVDVTPLDDDP